MEYITPVVTLTGVMQGLNSFKKCGPKAHITPIKVTIGVIWELNTFKMFAPEAHTVEQDVLMSPNSRGKLEDLVVGCVCCLVV